MFFCLYFLPIKREKNRETEAFNDISQNFCYSHRAMGTNTYTL